DWGMASSSGSVSGSVWEPRSAVGSNAWPPPGSSAGSRSVWEPAFESADSMSVWEEKVPWPDSDWLSGSHSGSVWGGAAWPSGSSPDSRSVWGASGSKLLAAASSRSVTPALATSPGGVSCSVWGTGSDSVPVVSCSASGACSSISFLVLAMVWVPPLVDDVGYGGGQLKIRRRPGALVERLGPFGGLCREFRGLTAGWRRLGDGRLRLCL